MAVERQTEIMSEAAELSGATRIRLRISVMLAVSIGLLVALAVLSVLIIQVWVTRQNTLDLLNEKVGFILNSVENDIAGHLNPVREQIEFIAVQIESGAYDIADRPRLRTLLTGALAPLPQVDRIVVIDLDLRTLAVRREETDGIDVIEREVGQNAQNPAVRNRLHAAEGAIWGDLVYRNGVTYISLQRALRRDGAVIGYIVTAISTTELSHLTDETSVLLSTSLDDGSDSFLATVFILHGPNNVLAHPNLISDNSLQSPASPAVKIRDVGDIVLGALWEGETIPGFEKAAAGDVKVVNIVLNSAERDQDYVAIYKWLDSYGEVPWAIGMWAPQSDLDNEMQRLEKAATGGLIIALLAVLAAVVVGRLLAKPIRAVSMNAVKVGDFDLKEIENLPPSRIRELDDEAAAFNTMLAGLRSFETYVPRTLVARLMRAEGSVISEHRNVTVMFTDIVGYTAQSENLTAPEVASFLNDHFSRLSTCVEAEDGTIDKFIGDSLMAFWGAPEQLEHTEERACRAAVAIAAAVTAGNEARREAGQPPVRLRIGIHTGDVVVGNIGSPGRINYTIVGDTVNTCQRLEALGKEIDPDAETIILVSKVTADALDGELEVKSAGDFEVRGRSETIEVYRLAV